MAKWTRENILRELLHREMAGLPLTCTGEDGVNTAFYEAGSRIFGSWRNAVASAGIAPRLVRGYVEWTPARILAAIRALARRQQPLRPAELHERHRHLVHAAQRCFGSWSKAVFAAGADPARLRRTANWTRERILEAILTRAIKNEPLRSSKVRPSSLVNAGSRVFGSWPLALAAAGIEPISALGKQSFAGPKTDGSIELPRKAGSTPGHTGGSGSAKPPTWTEQRVAEAVHARLNAGRLINAATVFADDRPLYRAAARRHGSWARALRAAGLDPELFGYQAVRRQRAEAKVLEQGVSDACSNGAT